MEQASLPPVSRVQFAMPVPLRVTARRECDNTIKRLGLPTTLAEKEKINGLKLEAKYTEECLKQLGLPLDHLRSSDEEQEADCVTDSETETDITEGSSFSQTSI